MTFLEPGQGGQKHVRAKRIREHGRGGGGGTKRIRAMQRNSHPGINEMLAGFFESHVDDDDNDDGENHISRDGGGGSDDHDAGGDHDDDEDDPD